jgi:hypothetical protein
VPKQFLTKKSLSPTVLSRVPHTLRCNLERKGMDVGPGWKAVRNLGGIVYIKVRTAVKEGRTFAS